MATNYNAITNQYEVSGPIKIPNVSVNQVLETNASNAIVGQTLTNGQLLIGNTGNRPSAVVPSGHTDGVVITTGAGTLDFNTSQPIATTSVPTFAGETLNGTLNCRAIAAGTFAITGGHLTGTSGTISNLVGPSIVTCDASGNLGTGSIGFNSSLVSVNGSGVLESTNLASSNANGITSTLSWAQGGGVGVLTLNNNASQDLSTAGSPSFAGETLTGALNMGTNPISTVGAITATGAFNNNGAAVSCGTITSGAINAGINSITGGALGGSSLRVTGIVGPAFVGVDALGNFGTVDTKVEGTLVSASATGALQTTTIVNSNGCNTSFAGSTLTESMTQDLGIGTGNVEFLSVKTDSTADHLGTVGAGNYHCCLGENTSGSAFLHVGSNIAVNAGAANGTIYVGAPNAKYGVVKLFSSTANANSANATIGFNGTTGTNTYNLVDIGTSTTRDILSTAGGQTIVGAETFSNTTDSTSSTTGAVIVSGGIGIAKNAYIGSSVATLNQSADGGGNDQSLTSATFSRPLSSTWREVYLATMAATTNWTASGVVTQLGGSQYAISYYLLYDSAGNLANSWLALNIGNQNTGVYMVEYRVSLYGNRGITSFQWKGNGAVGYTTLRSVIDQYVNNSGTQPTSLPYRDYFVVTTGGNPVSLKWLNNGTKNAGSSAYYVALEGPVTVTQIA